VAVTTTTVVGLRIKQALTQFGGYLVDDTGSKSGGAAICMEPGVELEVARAFPGVTFNISNPISPSSKSVANREVYADLLAIFRALQAVTNNGPASVGGGGKVMPSDQPPPICNVTMGTSASNTSSRAVNKGVLHLVSNCEECGTEWCDGGYQEESPAVEEGYLLGPPLNSWGCEHVLTGMARVRNSKSSKVYLVDANPVVILN
jgi:hypothetical protein